MSVAEGSAAQVRFTGYAAWFDAVDRGGDAGSEVRQARVLREVVVRTHAQARDDVEVGIARRQDDDRQRGRQRAQLAGEREPAVDLVAETDVDGALVGGASLDGEQFATLAAIAAGGPLP